MVVWVGYGSWYWVVICSGYGLPMVGFSLLWVLWCWWVPICGGFVGGFLDFVAGDGGLRWLWVLMCWWFAMSIFGIFGGFCFCVGFSMVKLGRFEVRERGTSKERRVIE